MTECLTNPLYPSPICRYFLSPLLTRIHRIIKPSLVSMIITEVSFVLSTVITELSLVSVTEATGLS